MKTTGSVQEKNGRFYFVVNLYDANGKRKIKWISTGLTVRGNKRKAESMLREVLLHYDETGELPTGRGGAYEKVDAKTAKPLPQHLQPVSKSEMLFLDYLNEWVQVHKASIQPATFISYNRMITGRITQYFEPLGLKLCEVTPQVLDGHLCAKKQMAANGANAAIALDTPYFFSPTSAPDTTPPPISSSTTHWS